MGFRDKYKKQKKDLLKRHAESVANKDTQNFPSIIDNSKIPKGIGFWKCGFGEHLIDYIPFEAGSNMPKVREANSELDPIEEGQYCWSIDLHVHTKVGAQEKKFVCPEVTNGEQCPICDYIRANRPLSKEDYSTHKPKRYTMHLIWCRDDGEEKKGLQLWEIPHYFMEKHIKVKAEKPKGGGTIEYYDPDAGRHVKFIKEGSDSKWNFYGYDFYERDEPIPDEILDQSFPLDSVIKYASYNEIYKAFYGEEPESEVAGDDSFPVEEPEQQQEEGAYEEQEEGVELAEDECPLDGEFGVDHEQLEGCGDCPNYDNCFAAKQDMEVPEPEPEPKKIVRRGSQRLRNTQAADKPAAKTRRPIRRPIKK